MKLFKKIQDALEAPVETKQKEITYHDVHNEFNTAAEKLIKEAKELINESLIKKSERLRSIGFSLCTDVVSSTNMANLKKSADYAALYAQKYPQYKFITYPQVSEICEKYGLVVGATDRYKGFVPEKNLHEIECFKIDEEDKTRYLAYANRHGSMGESWVYITKEQYEKKESPESFVGLSVSFNAEPLNMAICAPEKDFDTIGMTKIGHQLINDPIVLQQVSGGCLIVTAWGDEASDPEVVNEKMN